MSAGKPTAQGQPNEACITRSVIGMLQDNPTLEAVSINRPAQTISLATLGQADVGQLTSQLTRTVEQARSADSGHACQLLQGQGDCRGCSQPLPDVARQRITISHDSQTTTIARLTCPTAPKFWRWRDIPIPKLVPREVELPADEHDADEWKAQMLAAGLCGVFGLAAFASRAEPYSLGLYAAAYLAGSWFTAQEVWERLRQKTIDIHLLMLAVALGSASIGAWGEGAILLFLFSFSGALEHFALGRTQREIRALLRGAPKTAVWLEHGHEKEIEVERIVPGMRLLVRPGALFPVDAEVARGQTAADESNLTGEVTPVEKKVGDGVLAGTVNVWGAVELMATRPAAESSLSRIIRLIQEAQRQKAPAQQFTDKFSTYYTYFALALSVAMFFTWWLGFGLAPFSAPHGLESAFYRTMTLLVVASPCALVLSIPSAVLAAIAWSARHGILFRGGAAVERLASVKIVALDKTGTLTTGELRVESVESFPPGKEDEIARLAFSMERLSTHPLARAITRFGKQKNLVPLEVESFQSATGFGVTGSHSGRAIRVGRRDFVGDARQEVQPEPGTSEVWVSDGAVLGRILLRDDIRPESRNLIQELERTGVEAVVLTGDRREAAEHLQAELGIKDVRPELRPEDKLGIIQGLTLSGRKVAMVGDGVNDAPSLAAAHVGVAMGARGSDAALEQADIVLMHDRLENFLSALQLSRRARTVIRQNLVVSLGTVVVLVAFALMGKIPLTLGVIGHEGSTVLVVMNSLRLLFTRGVETPRVNDSGKN